MLRREGLGFRDRDPLEMYIGMIYGDYIGGLHTVRAT